MMTLTLEYASLALVCSPFGRWVRDHSHISLADSGGPGTYSQLLILKEYMGRLASDLAISEDDVYPADYFDLIGGVGFGGYVY